MNIPWTSIGLALDIFGVIILYFNGPPIHIVFPDGKALLTIESDESDKTSITKIKHAQRKELLSKISLIYIGFGFIFQFIGSLK
jgi:hypothetical protein